MRTSCLTDQNRPEYTSQGHRCGIQACYRHRLLSAVLHRDSFHVGGEFELFQDAETHTLDSSHFDFFRADAGRAVWWGAPSKSTARQQSATSRRSAHSTLGTMSTRHQPWRTAALLCLAPMVVSCGQRLDFDLPANATIEAFNLENSAKCSLDGSTDAAVSFRAWLLKNKDGWSQYNATPPAKGWVLYGPGLKVQVLDTSAIAYTGQGIYTQAVSTAMFANLCR